LSGHFALNSNSSTPFKSDIGRAHASGSIARSARLPIFQPCCVISRVPGFIEPCRPSKARKPPSGPQWVHEIKHDGFRLMVRRECALFDQLSLNAARKNALTAVVDASVAMGSWPTCGTEPRLKFFPPWVRWAADRRSCARAQFRTSARAVGSPLYLLDEPTSRVSSSIAATGSGW
jgi:hypothetical protein